MIEWMGDFFGFNAYAFDINTVYKPAGNFADVGELFTKILVILVSLAGVVAFVFIIISGLKFVTSSGDEKKLDSAKSTLTFSIIGITVVIMSFVIIRIVQAFLGSNVGIVGEGGSGSGPPPAATAGCTLSTGSVSAGGSLTVTSQNGLFGTIGMMGAYGTPVYSALGTLPANGSTPITVPAGATAGVYVVRVGGYAVGCTPDLSVNACPYDFNNDGVVDDKDAQIVLDYFGDLVSTNPAASKYDVNKDGKIDLSDALDVIAHQGVCGA